MARGPGRWGLFFLAALLCSGPAYADGPADAARREIGGKLRQPDGYEVLAAETDRAVVGVTALAPAQSLEGQGSVPEQRMNVYVYLTKGVDGWTVETVRNALQPGIRAVAEHFRSLTPAEMIQGFAMTEADAEGLRERLLLATSLDEALLAHFRRNRGVFETIGARLSERPPAPEGERIGATEPDFAKLFSDAAIAYADRLVLGDGLSESSGCGAPACFTLAVAFSPPDYKVGYFHLPPGAAPPRMSPREYLAIRPLGEGWYFFRQN